MGLLNSSLLRHLDAAGQDLRFALLKTQIARSFRGAVHFRVHFESIFQKCTASLKENCRVALLKTQLCKKGSRELLRNLS